MIKKPLVSIIIPCYNSGATIDRTLNSIASQSWREIEIIIINDGSTEKLTRDKLNQISMNKNITLINQANLGLASARNAGIAAAKGDYIVPLDADDWLEPDALLEMMRASRKEGPQSIIFSDIRLQGDLNGILRAYCNPFEQLFSNQLPYCMLFPRIVLKASDGYDKNFTSGFEDWELNIRLLLEGYSFCKADGIYFNYWVSKNGMLRSKSLKQYLHIFDSIKNKFCVNYKLLNSIKILRKSRDIEAKRNLWIYFIYSTISVTFPRRVLNFLVNSYIRSKHW